MSINSGSYRIVRVWDAPTRLFHWLNVFTVVLLFFTGFAFTLRGLLSLQGHDAAMVVEVYLQKIHSVVGYVFVINLAFRFVWAFTGNAYARWCAFLPDAASLREVVPFVRSLKQGRQRHYTGHNPAGRLAITAMLVLLAILAITGIVRAATDLYYPPLGKLYAEFVVEDGADVDRLMGGDHTLLSKEKYAVLRPYIFMTGSIHKYASYLLLMIVVLHIAAVVISEKREPGLVSAMISGRKLVADEEK